MGFWRRAARKTEEDKRPPLYLHTGLHKTGTTALQMAFNKHALALKGAGLLYPAIGIPQGSDGHHNLAWQLTRDRRFRAHAGTIDDMAQAVGAHGGPAILSSEDFETLLDRPEELDAIADHPRLAGHRIVIVLYLREQSAYFRSLYLELTRHGLTQEMARLAETVRTQGYFDLEEWRFQFDYQRIAAKLAAWRGGSLVLRSHHALTGGSTVTDFLSFTCPSLDLPVPDIVQRVHVARPLAESLSAFFAARLGSPLTAAQEAIIAAACAAQEGAQPDLSLALQARLQSSFAASNRSLAAETGLSLASAASRAGVQRKRIVLEALFSFEIQNRLTMAA